MVAGDKTLLAQQLGVPLPAVLDWLSGESPVPAEVFLRAVDIVLAANRKQNEENRALLERINDSDEKERKRATAELERDAAEARREQHNHDRQIAEADRVVARTQARGKRGGQANCREAPCDRRNVPKRI